MDGNIVLQTRNLSKKFHHFVAVNNMSFSLEVGKIYGLIGQNGAGKSTLMRLIMGLSIPSAGTIELFGTSGSKALQESRKDIGKMIEAPSIMPQMSALENLTFYKIMKGIKEKHIETELLKLVGLENVGRKMSKIHTFRNARFR